MGNQYNGREKPSHRRTIPMAAPLHTSPLPIRRKESINSEAIDSPAGNTPDREKQVCFAAVSEVLKRLHHR